MTSHVPTSEPWRVGLGVPCGVAPCGLWPDLVPEAGKRREVPLVLRNYFYVPYGNTCLSGRGDLLCLTDKKASGRFASSRVQAARSAKLVAPMTKASASRHLTELSLEPPPVLVSACLAGCECRFDGSANTVATIAQMAEEGRAVLVCPEEDGGLPTPRPPAEIVGGDGADVLAGRARVVTRAGDDVTEVYVAGARIALQRAQQAGAAKAILKSRSPSCGRAQIYDGTFTRTLVEGDGVTAALLRAHGIEVVTETDL